MPPSTSHVKPNKLRRRNYECKILLLAAELNVNESREAEEELTIDDSTEASTFSETHDVPVLLLSET